MEIKILEDNKKRLVFELIGADHTLCNSLKKELWSDSATRAASYKIEHPLIGIPKFIVDTNGQKEPRQVLKSAVKRLQKMNSDFLSAFKKAK
ncbi:DNA-directed RNA polymerase subunit L [Candidatus Woesearchaeota archaeon]|nr:DNA-directed RNA polymerase subunit L [Candidatus Woesearchaeota archaeon]